VKALVTGGAGFIGSAVVQAGLARNWEITVLDNLSTGYLTNLDIRNVHFVEGDVRQSKTVNQVLQDVDIVFHLAAMVGNVRSIEDPVADSETNVMGTLCLLQAMRAQGVRRLVYSSSAAIFGEPSYLPMDEQHPVEPDSPYGVSKLTAEKHCLCFGRLFNWDVACLRYFNVYGVNQRFDAYGNVIPIFATNLQKGRALRIYGDGNQTRDFVNVEDVANANCLAAEKAISGVFNIASGVSISINDLAQLMRSIWGIDTSIEHIVPRAGEVRHSSTSLAAAQHALGYEAHVSLLDGLMQYRDWLKNDDY
jgi:UDP-glucose 4-epimerase